MHTITYIRLSHLLKSMHDDTARDALAEYIEACGATRKAVDNVLEDARLAYERSGHSALVRFIDSVRIGHLKLKVVNY